jgi:hypothetical protein
MTSPATAPPPPESLGPGQETESGEVVYGVPGPVAFVTPALPPGERDRNMRAYTARCPRCQDVSDEVIAAVRAARKPGAAR